MKFLNNKNASIVTLIGIISMFTTKGDIIDKNKGKYLVNLFPGTELFYDRGYVGINLKLRNLLEGTTQDQGKSRDNDDGNTKGPLKNALNKVGSMALMIPIAIQLLSLPGALAQIKFSLMRSLFVAKLAIIIMAYNFIKNLQFSKSQLVVVPPPVAPTVHYHHQYFPHEKADEDDWRKSDSNN